MAIKGLLLFLFFLPFPPGEFAFAEDDFSAEETIEQAIATARTYARQEGIDLSGKFISKAEYRNNMQNRSAQPYWQILWINKKVTKGGGVELKLKRDGSIEVSYHK